MNPEAKCQGGTLKVALIIQMNLFQHETCATVKLAPEKFAQEA